MAAPSTTRRDFLRLGAAAAAVLGAELWPAPLRGQPGRASLLGADLVLLNGRVYTVDHRRPRAEAFAVRDGRFLALGSSSEIRELAAAGTRVIDAQGATVVPGFIDAHSHPAGAGLGHLLSVDCNLASIAEIQRAVRRRAEEDPGDTWITGFMYDDTRLEEGRPLSRHDLDQVVSDRPVRVNHRGGHTAVLNSRALALAGIDRTTPDPEFGAFGRDEQGELTGLVQERALELFAEVGRHPPEPTRAQRRDAVELISERMSRAGLTSVHDAYGSSLVPYVDAHAAGLLRCRFYVMAGYEQLYPRLLEAGLRTGFGDEWVRLGGVKLVADGSASERTMRMSRPFEGRPDFYGILTISQEELDRRVREIHQSGFQVGVHANGDVAIDMVLRAYEQAVALEPRPRPRHRIEHCTLVDYELLKRIRALGVVPTPFYTYVHYHGRKWLDYGEERTRSMFAHRWFLDHGIPVAAASDYPPGPFEPLLGIQSMVTRTDWEGRVWGANQRITVDEALRVCTIHGARASFEEEIKGSITPGKLADFVVLERDPHEVDPFEIKDIGVLRTVVGGETVHEA